MRGMAPTLAHHRPLRRRRRERLTPSLTPHFTRRLTDG
jgi:hypothetical protein